MAKLFEIVCAVLGRDRLRVSKVAFKLPKSNISQIRLWLFLKGTKQRRSREERMR